MKYTTKDSFIYEKPAISFKVYPLRILIGLIVYGSTIYMTVYSFVNGWDRFDAAGEFLYTPWSSWIALVLLIFSFIFTIMWGLEQSFPFEKKKEVHHYVRNFKPEYLHLDTYNEAYQDVLAEIKAGTFETDEWDDIFWGLNQHSEEFERKNKELKKTLMPRKDYVTAMKTFNEQYFGHE